MPRNRKDIVTDEQYAAHLKRQWDLFEHAKSDCTDPDCEIHNPWMQEDEANRVYSCALFIAGAQWAHGFVASQIDEMHERASDEMREILASPDRMEEVL